MAIWLNGKNLPPRVKVTPIEFEGMIGVSMAMRMVFQQGMQAAEVDVPVLIAGETGTVEMSLFKDEASAKTPSCLPVNMGAIAPELIVAELFGHEKGAYTGATEARAGDFLSKRKPAPRFSMKSRPWAGKLK